MNDILRLPVGICVKQCKILNRKTNIHKQLYPGDLLRILNSDDKNDWFIVKLYNLDNNIFETDMFDCPKDRIDIVVRNLWRYLIGTQNNDIRIRIYNERDLVLRMKCGDKIILKSYGNDLNANIQGVIQFIGYVQEVGYGNSIGLNLQILPQNHQTLESLYKSHYNYSKSMLLFRIEELIDAIKYTEETLQNGSVKVIKSELHKAEYPVRQESKFERPFQSKLVVASRTINMDHENHAVSVSNDEGKSICNQVNVPHYWKGAIPKNQDAREIIERKRYGYNRRKWINRIKPFQCHICNYPFGPDTLVLKCRHYLCIKCFAIKILRLVGTNRIHCSYVRGGNYFCNYQLSESEITQLRQKLNQFSILPASNNRSSTKKCIDTGEEEVLYKCKTYSCEGMWFIPKSSSANLYTCPLCKNKNCVDCKVVHGSITCTEYKKTQAKPNTLHNVTKQLNELVVSGETTSISSGSNEEETIINYNANLLKCPTCDLINCTECNAIEQNQTYEKSQEAKLTNGNSRMLCAGDTSAITHFSPPAWFCAYCEFLNFSGNICKLCHARQSCISSKINTLNRRDMDLSTIE